MFAQVHEIILSDTTFDFNNVLVNVENNALELQKM